MVNRTLIYFAAKGSRVNPRRAGAPPLQARLITLAKVEVPITCRCRTSAQSGQGCCHGGAGFSPYQPRGAISRGGVQPLRRHIVQDRAEPALDLAERHALAARIILDLVAFDLGHAEIIAFGMRQVDAGH